MDALERHERILKLIVAVIIEKWEKEVEMEEDYFSD